LPQSVSLARRLWSWFAVIPASFFTTGVLITIAIATSVVAPSGAWQQFLYRLWARMVLWICGVGGVRVSGAELLSPANNYVFVSNHLSLMDTPVLLRHLPVPFKFLAKKELLKVPFIGWYLRRAGHLTVDRGSIRSSLKSMNECAATIRDRRLSVLIFAEGTRGGGELQPFKEGAAYLSIQSGVPAAPLAIVGTNHILPARSSIFGSGEVELRIGEPVSPAGYSLKDRAAFTSLLENKVRALLNA
jgi:1-acyl-sn-glycerol-3-phosphate acyltransferase